jgi:hypothetical protein
MSDDVKIRERSITELKFTDTNPVKRTKRGRNTINQSLSELGPGRSVLIDENDVLVAGNGTVEQCQELGISRVIEIELPDRHTIVAVKKPDMTEDEKLRMAMFDNASAKLAVWDAEGLCEIRNQGVSVEGIFTDKEFDKIVLPGNDNKEQIEPDSLPEGDNKFYVVVETDNKESQEGLYQYLMEEGYQTMKYEGNKKG